MKAHCIMIWWVASVTVKLDVTMKVLLQCSLGGRETKICVVRPEICACEKEIISSTTHGMRHWYHLQAYFCRDCKCASSVSSTRHTVTS